MHVHHLHQVARSKCIAISTMRRQEGRSVARRNAKFKVEWFEIAVDCSKPGLTGSASWAATINREAIGRCS